MPYFNRFAGRPFEPRYNLPETFGEALSYEDQILWLARHFKELQDLVDKIDPEGLHDTILRECMAATQALVDTAIRAFELRLNQMQEELDAATTGGLIYDPTQGAYVNSKEAMRRVYAALLQSGDSHVHDMSQLTVSQLAGKGTHAYSVAALAEVDWSDEIGNSDPEASPYPGQPGDEALRLARQIDARLVKTTEPFDVDLLGTAVLTEGGYVAAPDEPNEGNEGE